MHSVDVKTLSLIVSFLAFIISCLSFFRDRPKPIVVDVSTSYLPDHSVFSYRESRKKDGESFFFFNDGILVEFKLINPSSKGIGIFDLLLHQQKTNLVFNPLVLETSGNARNDKILFVHNTEQLIQNQVSLLPLYETLDFTIPAYGEKTIRLFFSTTEKNIDLTPKMELSWTYAQRSFWWPFLRVIKRFSLKRFSYKFPTNPYLLKKPQSLQPEQILKSEMLHQLSSD